MDDYVEVYVDEAGEHRWRYKAAGNHEPLAGPQEGYANMADMMKAIGQVTNRVPTIVETKDAPLPGTGTIRIVKAGRG